MRPTQQHRQRILFVHGWWGGSWVWDHFVSHFSQLGYDCNTIDLYEDRDSVADSFDTHLGRLSQVTSELNNPILIGHSAGGLLIQKLLEQIDVPAAVLVSSAPPKGILAVRSWALIRALLKYSHTVLMRKPLLPSRKDMYSLNLNGLTADQQKAVYDRMVPISAKEAIDVVVTGVAVDASRVTTPMLVVNGSQDRLTRASVAKQIAKKYGATYREYPSHAHYMMRESGSKKLAIEIDQWLCEQGRVSGDNEIQYDLRQNSV